MTQIAIIGNGIAGITAARHIRKKSDMDITVISSETEYFFSRTALMYIFMGHMEFNNTKPYEDWFWKKNKITLKNEYVERIAARDRQLIFASGSKMNYDILILATGSKSNKFGWPGQDLEGVQGLYSYQDLQQMEETSKEITRGVIIGGGLIGIEMAEMLRSRGIEVTILAREEYFWDNVLPQEESSLISRHIREHSIDLRLETELKEIIGDENGKVKSVVTNHGDTIDCGFVGLTAGVSPNISFLTDSGIEIDKGILINEFLETNIKDVYAIGDCAQHISPPQGRRPIEQVWYTGRKMGETVASTICGDRISYQPGHWFNSAKFFDIEYQTYGMVGNVMKEGESSFYWEDSSGRKCMHFIFETKTNKFIGINSMGIRLRHEVFDRWLTEQREISHIMDHLPEANFDPEFFTRYETKILNNFQEKFPGLVSSNKQTA